VVVVGGERECERAIVVGQYVEHLGVVEFALCTLRGKQTDSISGNATKEKSTHKPHHILDVESRVAITKHHDHDRPL
jgi:hypothetical protein